MDFFNSLVIPQSADHIKLLHYMLILILFLFIPFISIIFGGTILSLFYRRRGYKNNNGLCLRFSKDIAELSTVNKSLGIILGIVPMFTAILIFVQLLHAADTSVSSYLSWSFILSAIGIILIYAYRYSLSFNTIFDSLKEFAPKNEEVYDEFRKFRKGSIDVSNKTGLFGIVLLFIGLWFFTAGVTFATYPNDWVNTTFIGNLFSWKVLVRFISFIIGSFGITGGLLFFRFFFWEGGRKHIEDNYKEFVRKTALKVTFASMILLPVFLLLDVIMLPGIAVSFGVFNYSLAAILLIFLVLHLLYSMVKYSNTRFSGSIFFVILLIVLSSTVKDELAMSNATQIQSLRLADKFETYMNGLKGVSTTAVAVRTGEQIYQTVCSACHSFDKVVVGPAYNDVLPQFEGKKDALVAFIRNPVKVLPNFPPMPNPGLSLAEAKNIADYEMITHMKDVFAQRKAEAGNDGEKLFSRICAACHAYDHDVVGPAFNDVLSKYVGKENDLISFVSNPKKVLPGYPEMPNPGLSPEQAKAVSTYVLEEYKEKKQ
ncbi:MAG: c-type cytochrome [Ignavibacteriaceae bacterium]